MSKEKIFKWNVDLYYGNINGMFVGTDDDVRTIKEAGELYFGSACGKHSDVRADFKKVIFTVVSKDPVVIEGIREHLPFGHDLMAYVAEKKAYEEE